MYHCSSSIPCWLRLQYQKSIKVGCLAPVRSQVLLDMAETGRVLQAATVLSQALAAASIPHAFHGSLLIAILSNAPECNVCNRQLHLSLVFIDSKTLGGVMHS